MHWTLVALNSNRPLKFHHQHRIYRPMWIITFQWHENRALSNAVPILFSFLRLHELKRLDFVAAECRMWWLRRFPALCIACVHPAVKVVVVAVFLLDNALSLPTQQVCDHLKRQRFSNWKQFYKHCHRICISNYETRKVLESITRIETKRNDNWMVKLTDL